MRIECDLCVVREWNPTDRDSVLEFPNNRCVWRNLTERFPHPYTEADADWWFAFLAKMAEPTHWAVEVDGLAVGCVGVTLGEGEYARGSSAIGSERSTGVAES